MIVEDQVPDTSKPRQHILSGFLEFLSSTSTHQVQAYAFTAECPAVGELVSFWGSMSHDADPAHPLVIHATSYERLIHLVRPHSPVSMCFTHPSDENYLDKVPSARRPMVIALGKVEGTTVNDHFTLAGSVWGVSWPLLLFVPYLMVCLP